MSNPMPAPEIGAAPMPSSSASSDATASTPDDRSTAFHAAPNAESVPGGTLLLSAYAVVWLVILFVVVRIFRRQADVARRIATLEASIARSTSNAADDAKGSREKASGTAS